MSATATQERPVNGQETQTVVVTPRADGWETAEAYFLAVEMPGVDETHADLTLEKNLLTVVGLHEPRGFDGPGDVPRRRFERGFRLPEGIDAGQLDATVRAGVLTVRIPKAAHAQRRKVSVRQA